MLDETHDLPYKLRGVSESESFGENAAITSTTFISCYE
jgi:hypothetical protein